MSPGKASQSKARRPWGTGSLREVEPGKWRIATDAGVDPGTGRRRQLTATVHGNRKAAQAALDALRAEYPRVPASAATLSRLHAEWWPTTTLAPSTAANWNPIIARHILAHLGDRKLRDLTAPMVVAWQRQLERDGVAVHTVAKAHMILSVMLSHGQALGWCTINVARLAPRPKAPARRRKPPGAEVGRRLLDAAAATDDRVMSAWLRVVLITGARRNEVLALRWTDIDWPAGTVTIARSLTAVSSGQRPGRRPRTATGEARTGAIVEGPTKTHAEKEKPLDPDTLAELLGLLGWLEQRAEAAGTVFDRRGFLFPASLDGTRPLRPERATRMHRQLCASAGIEGVTLHDLRHRAAAVMMAGGVSAQATADFIGHSKPSMTLDRYGGAVDDEMRRGAAVLADSLRRTS